MELILFIIIRVLVLSIILAGSTYLAKVSAQAFKRHNRWWRELCDQTDDNPNIALGVALFFGYAYALISFLNWIILPVW